MYRFPALLLIMFASPAIAVDYDVQLHIAPPTLYTDGSPFTDAMFSNFEICVSSKEASGPVLELVCDDVISTVESDILLSKVLIDGQPKYFSVRVFDLAGGYSGWSNIIRKAAISPQPPTVSGNVVINADAVTINTGKIVIEVGE